MKVNTQMQRCKKKNSTQFLKKKKATKKINQPIRATLLIMKLLFKVLL